WGSLAPHATPGFGSSNPVTVTSPLHDGVPNEPVPLVPALPVLPPPPLSLVPPPPTVPPAPAVAPPLPVVSPPGSARVHAPCAPATTAMSSIHALTSHMV